jgi:DNA modification methylase
MSQKQLHMYRVLAPGGFLCINIGDATRTIGTRFRLYSNHSRITSCCTALGFDALPVILWWKPTNAPNKFMGSGMLPAGAYVTLEHEYLLIFRKGGKREFGSVADKERRYESAYFWEERNTWFSDTWDLKGLRQEMNAGKELRERSAAYPFELPYRIINMYSVQGDTVLDPFLGTGTSMLASIASMRNSMGIEIEGELGAMIADLVTGCRERVNEMLLDRLRRHDDFVRERTMMGKPLKYANNFHGFPVMTRQEILLRVPFIGRIETADRSRFVATYEHESE